MKAELSWDIIKKQSGLNKDCFSYQDILQEYIGKSPIYLSKVLSKMVDKGMLIKLSRGLYHIVPIGSDAKTYIPDWHMVTKYIMKDKEYYIGYYSAMQIHGLITQPSLKEIVVIKHKSPSTKTIRGVEFQFVTHIKKRFFGFKNTWINNHDKVMVSDLEKTIVDAVTRPHLSGGMVEVGKAIYETRDKINQDKLWDYFNQNESHAGIKRYLFICNLFDIIINTHYIENLKNISTSFSLLDTSLPNQGKKNTKFGLKINLDTNTIKNAIYT